MFFNQSQRPDKLPWEPQASAGTCICPMESDSVRNWLFIGGKFMPKTQKFRKTNRRAKKTICLPAKKSER